MKPENRPFLIALTGGIASGKSTVSSWFENHGFTVYYADKIGHEMLESSAIISELSTKFGKQIVRNNKIDREKLGDLVFSKPENLQFLNRLLHPAIRKQMKRLIDTSTAEKIIFEIPLLFEGGLEKCFDLVINVYVDHETQISRLISRNNFTRIEAENRINSQLATKTKMDLADLNVDNNGSLIQLRMQLDRLVVNLDSFSPKEVESIS